VQVFDAHFHVVDPRFPLVPNDGYVPEAFGGADYRRRMARVELAGGAVVSGSFQAFDQDYLRAALAELGPAFVGVTQLPATVTDGEILALDAAGVRGVRFNRRRGGSASLRELDAVARRVHDLARWHVELYIDSRELESIAATLRTLPAVSIDHLGLAREGLPVLCRLAEQGVRVKATGFGRVDFDVRPALRDLWSANPDCLMFGTDLPSTRAPRPFVDADLDLILDAFDETAAARILYSNAAVFYRLPAPARGTV
jgi:predicted TIM-barrel fold metal-dependent hydrolase